VSHFANLSSPPGRSASPMTPELPAAGASRTQFGHIGPDLLDSTTFYQVQFQFPAIGSTILDVTTLVTMAIALHILPRASLLRARKPAGIAHRNLCPVHPRRHCLCGVPEYTNSAAGITSKAASNAILLKDGPATGDCFVTSFLAIAGKSDTALCE